MNAAPLNNNRNWFTNISILLAAFLIIFGQALFHGIRNLLGSQIDLLPALMVYTALSANLSTVTVLSIFGGLCADSLSANPLGVSVLPLFVAGLGVYFYRDLILREQVFAQITLGLLASAATPLFTLLLLLSLGSQPLLGWGTFWQFLVLILGGGAATPVLFEMFHVANRFLGRPSVTESSFRPDREIRRGRS